MDARPAIGSAAATMRFARCAVGCCGRRPRKTVRRLCSVLAEWRAREAGLTREHKQGRCKAVTLRRADLDTRFPGLLDAVLAATPPIADPSDTP